MIISAILRLLSRLPRPWGFIVGGVLVVLLIAALFWAFGQVQSCNYRKARVEYDEKEKTWKADRDKLVADAAAKEKRIAELEPKVLAYEQAAEQGKKVDRGLADKIDRISKEAADEAAVTDSVIDCGVRAERTCAKLRSLNPPILVDCAAYKRKVCSG